MAAQRSPFPPIADHAFLSDCHTGALVAPDGSVDWLCVPSFDSPSVFGSLLDRGAGSFRFGPYGINVPTGRVYNPGTNVVTTAWHAGRGWLLVQEALVVGPRSGPDRVTPHTRPPMDDDAAHQLVRVVECLDGEVEIELVCEPVFDYGRATATWQTQDEDGHVADVGGGGLTLRLATDMSMGIEGPAARARHVLKRGAIERRRGVRADPPHGALLARLALAGAHPRPPVAAGARTLCTGHQGPDLHAHGRHGGSADDLPAGDARRGTQLGLPLHVDA
jgi:hypothetical protein